MTLFLVFRDPGPAWVSGTATRQQPLWDEHATFMDRLFEDGHVILAGPYADVSRALVIVRAPDVHAAVALFRDDPWTINEILSVSEVIAWTIFLNSCTGSAWQP